MVVFDTYIAFFGSIPVVHVGAVEPVVGGHVVVVVVAAVETRTCVGKEVDSAVSY